MGAAREVPVSQRLLHQSIVDICVIYDLFSTYFRFMELAGTGSSQANLTAEPAEAVD